MAKKQNDKTFEPRPKTRRRYKPVGLRHKRKQGPKDAPVKGK